MTNYDIAFELVVGHEGGFTNDSRDRGNWTSGKIGVGTLKGTKYGVSAMAYPTLDIRNLTLDQAKEIYRRDYWSKVAGDDLPLPLAFLTFDAAVNHGVSQGAKFLQAAVGAHQDGAIGPRTLERVRAKDVAEAVEVFAVERQLFYTRISTWGTFGKGWTRRLVSTVAQALKLHTAPLSQNKAEPVVAPNDRALAALGVALTALQSTIDQLQDATA